MSRDWASNTATRPIKRFHSLPEADGRGPVKHSRPMPTKHRRHTRPCCTAGSPMCGLYRKGAASPGTQWSAGDNDEGHTRAKRDRMSAADAERPQRVAKQARMQPSQTTTSQRRKRKAQTRVQRQPTWKLRPARLLVHPLLLQNKLALLVLLRFLVGLQVFPPNNLVANNAHNVRDCMHAR